MITREEQSNGMMEDRLMQLVIPGAEPGHGLSAERIAEVVLALLYVAAEPPTVAELAAGAELSPHDIERGIAAIAARDSGLVIQRHGDRLALVTAPRLARQVRQFLRLDREARLSQAALETLAIIAYQQPVTRSEVEAVRGVDCSGVIATLHARGLIDAASRRPTVGNPIQYGTTPAFLSHFGLRSLADLPALGQINGQPGDEVLNVAMAAAEPPHASGAQEPHP